MATVQFQLASFENNLVRIVLEYNDATMRAEGVRVYNSGTEPVWAGVIRKSG